MSSNGNSCGRVWRALLGVALALALAAPPVVGALETGGRSRTAELVAPGLPQPAIAGRASQLVEQARQKTQAPAACLRPKAVAPEAEPQRLALAAGPSRPTPERAASARRGRAPPYTLL